MNERQLKQYKRFRRFIHWLIAIALVVYVVTGFGITEYQTVTDWTFGVLDKATSMKIHNNFEWPFAILLAVHIFVSLIYKAKKKKASGEKASSA